MEESISAPPSAPSDSPSGDIYSFPFPDPITMFHKSPQKSQMEFPIISDSLTYTPKSSLLQMESSKMILQDADSAYTADIPASNE